MPLLAPTSGDAVADTADLDYVHIVQRLGATVGDTPDDTDPDPDLVPITEGTITIVPTTPESRILVNGQPVSVMNAPIVCTVDAAGYLSYGGQRGVWIVDLGSPKVTPPVPRDQAAYTITYKGLSFGTQPFTKAPVSINPDSADLAGADFNLTEATSLPLPSGVTLAYIQGLADTAAALVDQKGVAGGYATLNDAGLVVNADGTTPGSQPLAMLARDPEPLITGTITRDATGQVTTADVAWPDGTPGTLTLTRDPGGAVETYTLTYDAATPRTFTQPAMTRDARGAVINRPAITEA